jgi:aspartyl-tRNA(Asn)/glutamyl-tRNA(Gln) amidotransferase subunit A
METLPANKPELVAEILDQLSPIGRALTKFQVLIPAPAYIKATWIRYQLRRALADAFERFDVIAFPTSPAPSPRIDNPSVELPSGTHPADFANVRLGGLANLAGTPAISIPCGFTEGGLPIGLQLLAPWGEDERLLDIAEAFEQVTERRYVDAYPPVAQRTPA